MDNIRHCKVCKHADPYECSRLRYPEEGDNQEYCECSCHDWYHEEDEDDILIEQNHNYMEDIARSIRR